MAEEKWTIHKYTLESMSGTQVISMPKQAQVLTCGTQFNQPRVWAIAPVGASCEDRTFTVLATGEDATEAAKGGAYIGTVLLDNGLYVLHVFEQGRYG